MAVCTATDQKAPPGLKTVTALWPARISSSSSCQLSGYWKRNAQVVESGWHSGYRSRSEPTQGNRPEKMENRRGGGLADLLPFGGLSELGKNAPNCLGHTACSLPVAGSGVPLGRAARSRSRLADGLAEALQRRQRASGTEAAGEGRSASWPRPSRPAPPTATPVATMPKRCGSATLGPRPWPNWKRPAD